MIFTQEYMEPIFDLIEQCKGVPQREDHHPEGDVHTHTAQVTLLALRESYDTDLILAAMLHDVGKIVEGHGHEDHSVVLINGLASVKTIWLVQHHLRARYYISGEMRKLDKCRELAGNPWFGELMQLVRWDTMGRRPRWRPAFEPDKIRDRLNECAELHFQGAQ